MSRRTVLSVHPLTRQSIELQRVALEGGAACGCHGLPDPAFVWLCEYHEGYDDGVEAASGPSVVEGDPTP